MVSNYLLIKVDRARTRTRVRVGASVETTARPRARRLKPGVLNFHGCGVQYDQSAIAGIKREQRGSVNQHRAGQPADIVLIRDASRLGEERQ